MNQTLGTTATSTHHCATCNRNQKGTLTLELKANMATSTTPEFSTSAKRYFTCDKCNTKVVA
jgi:DNA-directed RNA polymerase subunit RPC12/RpoP